MQIAAAHSPAPAQTLPRPTTYSAGSALKRPVSHRPQIGSRLLRNRPNRATAHLFSQKILTKIKPAFGRFHFWSNFIRFELDLPVLQI